jgi:Right handed beta helix region
VASRPATFVPADTAYRNRILTEDTTWRGQILIEGSLTIASQATLTIIPGTTIRFRATPDGAPGFLLIRGRIQANGTSDQPIIFTSDLTSPAPGDWQGIMVLDSSKKNLLEWCHIEGAVTGVDVQFSELILRQTLVSRCRTGLSSGSSTVMLSNGGISACTTGLVNRGGDADLSEAHFSGNGRAIAVFGGSLFLAATQVTESRANAFEATGARLRLEGNTFTRNGSGLVLNGCRGDLAGNKIQENRGKGLELADSPLMISGNRITGNGGVGVMVHSGGGTLWDNTLEGNGGGELTVTGSEDLAAPANWWGSDDPVRIRKRIKESSDAKVLFTPFLEAPPR